MSDINPPLITDAERKQLDAAKRKRTLLRVLPYAVTAIVALVIGALIGGAGADEAPAAAQPTVTVTAEPEPIAVEGGACKAVALEVMDILNVTVNEIVIPQNEIGMNLIEQLMYGADIAVLEADTERLATITSTTSAQTARVDAITPAYEKCVTP